MHKITATVNADTITLTAGSHRVTGRRWHASDGDLPTIVTDHCRHLATAIADALHPECYYTTSYGGRGHDHSQAWVDTLSKAHKVLDSVQMGSVQ